VDAFENTYLEASAGNPQIARKTGEAAAGRIGGIPGRSYSVLITPEKTAALESGMAWESGRDGSERRKNC